MQNKSHQQIAIIDFGSQYTHLISRGLRNFSVLARIYPPDVKIDILRRENLIGLILSGGPMSVYDKTAIDYDCQIFDLNIPILGLCYGHQLIAQHFEGKVKHGKIKEYGFASLKLKIQNSNVKTTTQTCLIGSPPKRRNSKLFHGLPDKLTVWMSHGDSVVKLPPGFDVLAKTSDCPIAAMGNLAKNIYGLQFHPEVHHTKDKDKILYNFAVKICKARQDWKIDDLLTEIIKDIKKQAKNKKVFMLVSGGVDSSVAFALLEKSLGKKNVIGLHIDSGLMRKNESAKVKQNLAPQACGAGFDDLNVADASETFLTRLHGISDPEQKRKIIGEAYLDAAEQWFKKRGDREGFLLGQGTIYPDTIETGGTKHADTIKTHHNRIDRIQKMIKQGKIIEPLKNFYKDEVRAIGRKLGLPNHLLNRHPFPGPGLGIRILCSSYRDAIYRVPKITANFPHQILPIKSVGVQGDCRTYAHPIAVWGINNWDKLEKISTNLTNKHQKINRVIKVCWVRTKGKPKFKRKPNACLTKERLDLLREINDIVEQEIRKNNIYDKIWQFPVVLAPLTLSGGESVILRPIESREAMTANFYKMDHKILTQIVRQISQFTEIDAIFYDVTNKPPSTIEWE